MCSYAEKLKAVKLYLKYESHAAVINELGYPSRMALRDWIAAYRMDGDVQKEMTRMPKYTEEQNKQRSPIILSMVSVSHVSAENWIFRVKGY